MGAKKAAILNTKINIFDRSKEADPLCVCVCARARATLEILHH